LARLTLLVLSEMELVLLLLLLLLLLLMELEILLLLILRTSAGTQWRRWLVRGERRAHVGSGQLHVLGEGGRRAHVAMRMRSHLVWLPIL